MGIKLARLINQLPQPDTVSIIKRGLSLTYPKLEKFIETIKPYMREQTKVTIIWNKQINLKYLLSSRSKLLFFGCELPAFIIIFVSWPL